MSIFNRTKRVELVDDLDTVLNTKPAEPVKEEEPKSKPAVYHGPAWKGIIGYKALAYDMKSFYGGMQYELGVKYTMDEGEVLPCHCGYHFCRSLDEVVALFPPEKGNRYFKVRARVKHNVFEKDGEIKEFPISCGEFFDDVNRFKAKRGFGPTFENIPMETYDKYVGNEIELLEEVPFEEIKPFIKVSFLQEENTYRKAISFDVFKTLEAERIMKATNNLFSLPFIQYLLDRVEFPNRNTNQFVYLDEKCNKIVALGEVFKHEEMSQDMRILMVLKELKIL